MPNARTVFIDVLINEIDPLDFDVKPSAKNIPPLITGTDGIVFQNDHHDGFEIHFELQGNTFGYFFPPNNQKHDAIWSQKGSACPDQSGVWDVFQPIKVVEPVNPLPGPGPVERRTLIVRNKNPGPPPGQGKFMYNLRVTNGTDWKNLDPGGDNQNGPITRFDWSYALVGVGSAIATTATIALAVSLSGHQLFCPSL